MNKFFYSGFIFLICCLATTFSPAQFEGECAQEGCHDTLVKGKSVHSAVEDDCTTCHEVKDEENHEFTLAVAHGIVNKEISIVGLHPYGFSDFCSLFLKAIQLVKVSCCIQGGCKQHIGGVIHILDEPVGIGPLHENPAGQLLK